ncbi:MAG: hypothetical protein M1334_01740, partial [Patescibacteria group bacterium]|nr:hypothetical protein [Patescibacteria group bacterium]
MGNIFLDNGQPIFYADISKLKPSLWLTVNSNGGNMVDVILMISAFVFLAIGVVLLAFQYENKLVEKQRKEDLALKDAILAQKQDEKDRVLRGDPRRGYPFNVEKRMENPQPYFGAARVAVEAKIYRKKLEGVIGRMGLKLDLGVSIGDMENVIANFFNNIAFNEAIGMVREEGEIGRASC